MLDGKNTFHGMGIIASVTPAVHSSLVDLEVVGKIELHYCKSDPVAVSSMVYPSLPVLIAEDI